MNCLEIREATEWKCQPVTTDYGDEAFHLLPPVKMWDGTVLPVYVFRRGDQLELTDDGAAFFFFDIGGFDLSCDQRKWRGIERAVERWGVTVSADGALQMLSRVADLRRSLGKYLGAMFALSQWEHEHAGRPLGSDSLMIEVEHYLRLLNPQAWFRSNVETHGISGRPLTFALQYNSTLVESLIPHHAATNALISKLVDFRALTSNVERLVTVVVDDRGETERVRGDIQVLTQLAHPVRLSHLESQARSALTPQ